MPLTFQDGFTKDSITGQVIGVGDLTGGGIPASSNGNPNITLPGGQIISGSDPNYGAYAAQQATMSGSQLTSSQIPIGGYVPGGNRSALPTTITNNQIPSALPDIKTASALSSKDTNLSNEATLLKAQNDALKAQQANEKAGGLKQTVMDTFNKNPNGIANNAFIQAVAQATYGRPATADELQKGGQFGLQGLTVAEVVRRFGLAPSKEGATDYPPTQVEPAPEVANDQGLLDFQKSMSVFQEMLTKAQQDILAAQSNLDTFQNQTQRGVNDIGQQLGRTASLVQGEQLALKQQRQADEDMLVRRLGIAEQAKGFAVEQANMQMRIEEAIYQRKRDIVSDARQLRKDQQEVFASTFDLMLKSGMAKGTMDKATMDMITNMSKLTGIPSGLYVNALDAAYNDKLKAGTETQIITDGSKQYVVQIRDGKVISKEFLGNVKSSGGGSGGASGFTSQEKRKLEQLGLLDAPRQDQLDALYGSDGSTEDVDFYIQQYLDGNSNIVDEDGNIKYSSIPAKLRVAFGERLAEVNDYNTALENNQIDYGWSGNGSFGNFVDKTTSVVNRFMNMF